MGVSGGINSKERKSTCMVTRDRRDLVPKVSYLFYNSVANSKPVNCVFMKQT